MPGLSTENRAQPDIEHLRRLAQEDPEAFEVHRQQLIEAALANVPEARQARLRGLQWKIDQVRGRSPTPIAACMALSRMMWQSVTGPNGLIDALNGRATDPAASPRAPVVRLPERRH